jgi:uncharacterized protein (TIGR00255 family)
MRSMTGFGIGEAPLCEEAGGKICVEIRSVNHRFLDVRVKGSRELQELTSFVEHLGRERLGRGRFEVSIRTEGVHLGVPVLDKEKARAAFTALKSLRDELAPGTEVPLSLLGALPDLFVSSVEQELDRLRRATQRAFDAAVHALDDMRQREGGALADDLRRRLEAVRKLARLVQTRAPDVVDAHRKRLKERAERIRAASDLEVDSARLEQEIALFAERIDICEELTRLDSHCEQFESLIACPEAVGRRLDFLLQEMAREANTVGAKSPDALISHAIIEVKAEIERMREQVQNVE